MNANVIFVMLLAGILSSNYAVLHFPGTGVVPANARPARQSLALGLGTTAVMVLAGLVCRPVNACLLGGADDFRILAFMARMVLNF